MNSALRLKIESETRREARTEFLGTIIAWGCVVVGVAVTLPVLKWALIEIMLF
jgi:hypothetical protein